MSRNVAEMKHAIVAGFIDDDQGYTRGLNVQLWPGGEERRVIWFNKMEGQGDYFNRARMSFDDIRFRPQLPSDDGRIHRVEEGAFLLLKLHHGYSHAPNTSVCDWVKVITRNRLESVNRLSFGQGLIKVQTPHEVRKKLAYYTEDPNGQEYVLNCQDSSIYQWPNTVEYLLNRELAGQNRFQAQFFLYDTKGEIFAPRSRMADLQSQLVDFFADPKFSPVRNKNGRLHLQVRPHLLIRHFNANGEVEFATSFLPNEALTKPTNVNNLMDLNAFCSSNQCADRALAKLKPAAGWSILPCRVYTCAPSRTKLGVPGNYPMIKNLWTMANLDVIRDGQGKEPGVRNLGLKFDSFNQVVDVAIDAADTIVKPVLLTKDGQSYVFAPKRTDDDSDRPSLRPG